MYTRSSKCQRKDSKSKQTVLNRLSDVYPAEKFRDNPELLVNNLDRKEHQILEELIYLYSQSEKKGDFLLPGRGYFAEKFMTTKNKVSQVYGRLRDLGLINYKQWNYGRTNLFKLSKWLFDPEVRVKLSSFLRSIVLIAIIPFKSLFSIDNLKKSVPISRSYFNNYSNSTYTRKGNVKRESGEGNMGLPKPKGGWKPTPDDQRSPFERDSHSQKGEVGGVTPPVSSERRPEIKRYVASSGERPSSYKHRAQAEAEIARMTTPPQESIIIKRSTYVALEDIPDEQYKKNIEEAKKMSDPSFNFLAWARNRRKNMQ